MVFFPVSFTIIFNMKMNASLTLNTQISQARKESHIKHLSKVTELPQNETFFCIFIKTYNFILFLLILFCPIFQFWLSFSKSTEIKSLKSTEAPHGIYDLSYKVNWNKSVMVEHTFNITLERLGQEYCK